MRRSWRADHLPVEQAYKFDLNINLTTGKVLGPKYRQRSSRVPTRRGDARIAENGFATSSGVNKSVKVVLI
jgi:hypothetical protein